MKMTPLLTPQRIQHLPRQQSLSRELSRNLLLKQKIVMVSSNSKNAHSLTTLLQQISRQMKRMMTTLPSSTYAKRQGWPSPGKRNRGRPRIKRNLANVLNSCHSWEKITMTEEELEENFRKQGNKSSMSSKQVMYYCAHGRPRMACPVKVKVKELANGVRIIFQNSMMHREHRKYVVGLTKKQKDFVDDCFRKGVTRPADILLSFKHEGLEEPQMAKLRGYLTRVRGKQKNKSIVDEKRETPPEEVSELLQSMQGSKVEADRDAGLSCLVLS